MEDSAESNVERLAVHVLSPVCSASDHIGTLASAINRKNKNKIKVNLN